MVTDKGKVRAAHDTPTYKRCASLRIHVYRDYSYKSIWLNNGHSKKGLNKALRTAKDI